MITLKTVMTASLAAPDELALYYIFDDGPAKTVYSYERMKFDLAANQLIWNSGTSQQNCSEYKITSATAEKEKNFLTFEKFDTTKTDRYFFEISKTKWSLAKYEIATGAMEILRSKYEFIKSEALYLPDKGF